MSMVHWEAAEAEPGEQAMDLEKVEMDTSVFSGSEIYVIQTSII